MIDSLNHNLARYEKFVLTAFDSHQRLDNTVAITFDRDLTCANVVSTDLTRGKGMVGQSQISRCLCHNFDKRQRRIPFDQIQNGRRHPKDLAKNGLDHLYPMSKVWAKANFLYVGTARGMLYEVMSSLSNPNALRKSHRLETQAPKHLLSSLIKFFIRLFYHLLYSYQHKFCHLP